MRQYDSYVEYLLITNGNVWDGERVLNGPNSIHVKNGLIHNHNSGEKAKQSLLDHADIEHIDLGTSFITPGFIDAHTHILHAGDRQFEKEMRKQGASYLDILKAGGGIKHTVQKTCESSNKHLKKLIDERFSKMQTTGTTTIEVKTGYGLSKNDELNHLRLYAEWSKEKKARIVPTLLMAHTVPDKKNRKEYLEEVVETAKIARQENLTSRFDVFLESGAFSQKETEFLLSHACSLGYQITLHAGQFSEMNGVDIAVRHGASSIDHAEHLKTGDVKKLSESGIAVGILPMCNIELDTNIQPDARFLIDSGVEVFLATDLNAGSSFCTSLLDVGRLALRDLKMTNEEILKSVTSVPAKTIGLKKIGKIKKGYIADLGVWKNNIDKFFEKNNKLEILFVEGNKVVN